LTFEKHKNKTNQLLRPVMSVAPIAPFFHGSLYRSAFNHDVFLLASFNFPLAALLIMQLQFYSIVCMHLPVFSFLKV